MIFSKSFGYALRGILYVSLKNKQGKRVSIEEIAEKLAVPRHFLSKIMNRVAKGGILNSAKGIYGGFYTNESTASTPLIKIFEMVDDGEIFTRCALGLRKCNLQNPCPLHNTLVKLRDGFYEKLNLTTIKDLMTVEDAELVKSLSIS